MWEISTQNQLITVVYSLCCGACLCAVYDVIRAMRKTGQASFLATFIGDILFFSFSAVTVFFLLLSRVGGEIRGYVLFAVALGAVLFRISISRVLYFLLCFIFSYIQKALKFISTLIKRMCLWLNGGLSFVLTRLGGFLSLCKKLLKKRQKMLYNNKKCDKAGENTDGR